MEVSTPQEIVCLFCHMEDLPCERKRFPVHEVDLCTQALVDAGEFHRDVACSHNDNGGAGNVVQYQSII